MKTTVDVPDVELQEAMRLTRARIKREAIVAGVSAPATDALIAACGHHRGARLEHADSDFERISTVAGHGP